MEAKDVLQVVANYGFPMGLSLYLLFRMESKLDRLTVSIEQLSRAIEIKQTVQDFANRSTGVILKSGGGA